MKRLAIVAVSVLLVALVTPAFIGGVDLWWWLLFDHTVSNIEWTVASGRAVLAILFLFPAIVCVLAILGLTEK